MSKVIFLDYDGVVNNVIWDTEGKDYNYNHPDDNKVNDFQAVQWVSKFCLTYGYDIVVTSTWRKWNNYRDCLINGGLKKGIEILGKVPILNSGSRGDEIKLYLDAHPEITDYLIIDDDYVVNNYPEMQKHFVHCKTNQGFNMEEYRTAELILEELEKEKVKE